jgi:hypothetical protein
VEVGGRKAACPSLPGTLWGKQLQTAFWMIGAVMFRFKNLLLRNEELLETLVSEEGIAYFPLVKLSDLLGINLQDQRHRWLQHPFLRQGLLRYESNGKFVDLIRYDMALLWLSGLNPSDVAPIGAEELWEFQGEIDGHLDMAMYKHFFEKHPWFFSWLDDKQPAIEAYRDLLGQLNLAREQMIFTLFVVDEASKDDQ